MSSATFILSTGRCGTQWIAHSLQACHAIRAVVEHEPLRNRLDPRLALSPSVLKLPSSPLSQVIREHAEAINRLLDDHSYIECGHTCWSSVAHLAELLPGKTRVIHLVRHPVPTACSWLTHRAFQKPLLPHLPEKVLLSPFDDGSRFTEYRESWETLLPFEKCLYYWLEVNALALDLESRLGVPWLRLKFEDLFGGDGLEELFAFLEVPLPPEIRATLRSQADDFRYVSDAWQDWRIIENHPSVLTVLGKLGYSLDDIDDDSLRRRYLPPGSATRFS